MLHRLAEGSFEVDLATGRFGTLAGGYPVPDYLEFKDIKAGFPTLGEFVLFYGDPCYVWVREYTRGMVRTSLFYPGLVMTTVGTRTDGIAPHHRIKTLSLLHVASVCYSAENRAEISNWRGFAAINSYR